MIKANEVTDGIEEKKHTDWYYNNLLVWVIVNRNGKHIQPTTIIKYNEPAWV